MIAAAATTSSRSSRTCSRLVRRTVVQKNQQLVVAQQQQVVCNTSCTTSRIRIPSSSSSFGSATARRLTTSTTSIRHNNNTISSSLAERFIRKIGGGGYNAGVATASSGAVLLVVAFGAITTNRASAEASSSSSSSSSSADSGGKEPTDLWSRIFGGSSSEKNQDNKEQDDGIGSSTTTTTTTTTDDAEETCQGGPGKRVKVDIEPEVIESLPVMDLDRVRKCDGSSSGSGSSDDDNRLLVTYEGIVYDVTEFVKDHPGGYDLVHTAAGWDLEHFFANYTVHGQSNKAAQWLAPLAVGKLSPEDAERAKNETTPTVHVNKRQQYLQKQRRKIVFVAVSLPFWITVRTFVSWVGWFIPPLGRLLARAVPVSVPGLTQGSEPLHPSTDNDQQQSGPYKVAIIGGGIAGCGAAWALSQSGFDVTVYEARADLGGNARTFDWDFSPFRKAGEPQTVRSCVSVTAWPPIFYKNYTCLLDRLGIETVHQPLSWFINSKVPGYEGTLWEADPAVYGGSLRKVFERDFRLYKGVCDFTSSVTKLFTLKWTPWRWNDLPSMYDTHQGLGMLNPLTVVPLYSLFKLVGGSDAWWNIVFTPQYTASFLVDELRPFPAVFGPLIEAQIPLNPNDSNSWQGSSELSEMDCNITTCVTWKDAGKGIRKVFELLVNDVNVKKNSRVREVQVLDNGRKRVYDEYDNYVDVDRVIFACPANAVGNIYKSNSKLAKTIFSTLVYADDHHPSTGHMHAIMHSDASVIPSEFREDCLKRASNYVEVTQLNDGTLNIENQYNFGVQTPGPGIYRLGLDQKPVMLIGHALGEGKSYDESLIRGEGNHARAHPLYSGWNVASQLSLRLVQGQNGIYYCSNWTTPGNCHDMSFLSGLVCAHAIGAKYPFSENREARMDFSRLRDLMGI